MKGNYVSIFFDVLEIGIATKLQLFPPPNQNKHKISTIKILEIILFSFSVKKKTKELERKGGGGAKNAYPSISNRLDVLVLVISGCTAQPSPDSNNMMSVLAGSFVNWDLFLEKKWAIKRGKHKRSNTHHLTSQTHVPAALVLPLLLLETGAALRYIPV